jgi:hypothetical protein
LLLQPLRLLPLDTSSPRLRLAPFVVVVWNNPVNMANSNKTVFPDPVGALHTNDASVFVSINSIISLCIALKNLFYR